jgi:chitosanase
MSITFTADQKRAIDSVLSIFETGRVPTAASYATCTILADGAGISYGKHQCTDAAGSLDLVVKKYIELGGAHAEAMKAFLPHLAANASTKEPPKGPWSATTTNLVNLLKTAGADPVMQRAQDEVFDSNYFLPAVNHANQIGLTKALSLLVVYDTCIHSGPGGVTMIRNMFAAKSPANGGSEEEWVKAYLNARRNWLATHQMAVLHGTVYRMDALLALVQAGNWTLALPFVCRGQTVA